MKRIAMAFVALMLCASSAFAGPLEDGLAAFDAKKYQEARTLLAPLAEEGNAKAQDRLGWMYLVGVGVAKEYVTALKWFRLAAAQNDPNGQNNLGWMYRNGFGVKQDYEESIRLFRLSAAKNNRNAQNNLGSMYRNGFGVKQDYEEAVKWFRLAAAQNNSDSQNNLGWMHRDGIGVKQDHEEAIRWFRLAASQNNFWAQNNLGLMYRNGYGVVKDYAEALRWFRLSAAQNHHHALGNLGNMFENGFGVTLDYEEAARWYLLGAAQGNDYSKTRLESTLAIKSAAQRVSARGATTPVVAVSNPASDRDLKEAAAKADADKARQTELVERLQAEAIASAKRQSELEAQLKQSQQPTSQLASLTSTSPPKQTVQPTATLFAHRRALVIGNDTYKNVPKLLNAREDARAIAESLQQVGYQVTLKLDLNEKDMKVALRNFKSQVEGGDEVLVFYAGHGVQIGAANYLLPVDIAGESEEQIKDDGIQLQRILDDMSERKAKFTLAMIDACRDNPFKTAGRALGGRGLSPTTAATGQMVIFSAGAGQQALDKLGPTDKSKNGLFTRVFLKEMQKPGVSIDRVVRNVRNDVVGMAKSVGHEQVPAIYDQVVGEFYFRQ